MKKIGIDARLYFQTGVGVYLRNLIYHLQKTATDDLSFYVYVLEQDGKKIYFENKNFIKREVPYKWHSFNEQLGFKDVLLKDTLDLMHFTYFSYPIFYNKKFIATVHDLTPLLFKTGRASTQNKFIYEVKHKVFKHILSSQIGNALEIITPTRSVKKQIVQEYGKKFENKITPIYEGIDHELTKIKENFSLKDKFKKPFFVYVGTFYPHKNVERLVRAFSKVKGDFTLILAGPEDHFTAQINRLIQSSGQENRIILHTKSSREDLVFFYKNALALVHPSLSEGFGLPIVEAAYFNLPIIASGIDVFKELLSGNYLQFDPFEEDDIAEKLRQFIDKKPKFNYAGLLKNYSFEHMAQETLNLYGKYV